MRWLLKRQRALTVEGGIAFSVRFAHWQRDRAAPPMQSGRYGNDVDSCRVIARGRLDYGGSAALAIAAVFHVDMAIYIVSSTLTRALSRRRIQACAERTIRLHSMSGFGGGSHWAGQGRVCA